MIVTIHQPEHLPWLGFFDKIRQADVIVLLDTTQFAKEDFQNRNRIKTENGPVWLTVPVFKKGKSSQLITETEIFNDKKWQKRCWNLIYQYYKNAPFFEEHKQFFNDLYTQQWTKLVDLNITIIRYLVDQFGLKTKIVTASELDVYEKGSTSVLLSLCKSLGADIYLSGKFGKNYLDENQFEENNIKVKYQDFHHPIYQQLWGEFIANMSSIDLLFNCGESSLDIISKANIPVNSRK